MTSEDGAPGALAGLRVVEVGEWVSAPFAAKLFADFGADVVKVERPGAGDPARTDGPFPDDRPDSECSGLFLYLNTNKRGVQLDLRDGAGRASLERLLEETDLLITNLPRRRLLETGLDPESLRSRHPGLIVTTITPFGLDGPYADYLGDELVTYAMGGLAYASPGVPDVVDDPEAEPPLHPHTYVADTIGGLVAAVASMVAVFGRGDDGEGAHVDVSQQAAITAMEQRDLTAWSYGNLVIGRMPTSIARMPNYYLPCRDGYVALAAPWDHQWARLVKMMGSPEWALSELFCDDAGRTAYWDALKLLLTDWTMRHDGEEIVRMADEAGLPFFAYYSIAESAESEHVRARGSLVEQSAGGRTLRMPGAPLAMHGTPWTIRRPAPRLGEHTDEVLAGRERPPAAPRAPAGAASPRPLPLAGVRVLDFGQVIAMPFGSQWLAWLGAEVLLVESVKHMTARVTPPYVGGVAHHDNSGHFNLLNGSKKSLRIDMGTPEGLALLKRLVPLCDVMIDNFKTGVLEKLGLGPDVVRGLHPEIVQLSFGAFGRSGPMRTQGGLHSAVNLFSGVAEVTGYAGGMPRILGGVLPDPIAGSYAVFGALAALRHRRRGGGGQYIDGAMFEGMISLVPQAVIDVTMNGRAPQRIGNRDHRKVPHNLYRAAGDDEWVAISVDPEVSDASGPDAQWRALCAVIGADARDPLFSTPGARRANEDALDARITAWTRERTPQRATELLQAAGVPAGPVLRPDQLHEDPQLRARGFLVETEHPTGGRRRHPGIPWRASHLEPAYRAAPLLGEHTRDVLTGLLGLTAAEYDALDEAGVLR
ncbi:MAG: CoA transferase [Chloroflexi bacterium]|nr:CoA transferase [Chloroflexota bacterium]